MQRRNPHIIISGGGTGGHIFPALAIARALKEMLPDAMILFIGAKGKMEMEKVPAAGFPIKGLWISGLRRELSFDNLVFPFKVIFSTIKSIFIIRKFKADIAVGVGGFASGPALRAASLLGVPTVIQEQNSFPGITNKMLGRKASKICVAYEGMEKYFPKEKIILTGNPVRQDLLNKINNRDEALTHFKLSNKKTILIIGGSLGARTINQSVIEDLNKIGASDCQILWQTGKNYFTNAKKAKDESGFENVNVMDFIARMDLAYACADVIISRAGAGTISELCLVGKPVILVPSPNVAEDHQTQNALALVNKNAAIMIRDVDAPDSLIDVALDLINNENKKSELAKNISELALKDSAIIIAQEVLKLIK